MSVQDVQEVQQATQVYCSLLWEYDRVRRRSRRPGSCHACMHFLAGWLAGWLAMPAACCCQSQLPCMLTVRRTLHCACRSQVLAQQAAELSGTTGPMVLPPAAQRRMLRILRCLDMHALDKLLLWESYFKEAGEKPPSLKRAAAAHAARLRRLKARVAAAIKQLDEQAVSAGRSVPAAQAAAVEWRTRARLASVLPACSTVQGHVGAALSLAAAAAVAAARRPPRGSLARTPTTPTCRRMCRPVAAWTLTWRPPT